MERPARSICISFLLLFAISLSSRAQIIPRGGEASGTFAYAHVDGVTSNNHFLFGGSGSYNLNQAVAVGFEYTYTPLGSENLGGGVSGNAHLQTYGGVARFSFSPTTRTVPYVLAGFGGANEKAVASAGGLSASASVNGYYFAFGGGASVFAGPNWGIRPEFRYERQQFGSNSGFSSFGQNDVQATVSIFYQFGGKAH